MTVSSEWTPPESMRVEASRRLVGEELVAEQDLIASVTGWRPSMVRERDIRCVDGSTWREWSYR